MSTRVFVRLYDGMMQYETDDEVLELPPPPLRWKDAITAMVAAVGKQGKYEDGVTTPKARLFLLPTDATGIAAELNARSLRFGVRENDRFVICLRGEDYQQPNERQASMKAEGAAAVSGGTSARPVRLSTPSSSSGTTQPSISPYANGQDAGEPNSAVLPSGNMEGFDNGGLGGGAQSGSLTSSGKKGNKRYRSISGRMAAIKSLGDMGLISNDDRGHLKDLLLNNDLPQLQEALDKYNNTGDFQAVKELLLKEIQNPLSKRNATDWLSESFVNDIALDFNTAPRASNTESTVAHTINNAGRFNPAPTAITSPANSYRYQTTSQSTPINSTGYSQSSPVVMNQYSASGSLVSPVRGNVLTSNRYSAGMPTSNGYQPMTVMPQLYHQPQALTTNNMYGAAPQINLPLRDRATYMKRGYDSSPVHNVLGITSAAVPPATSAQMGMNGYIMQQGYAVSQGPSYPADIIYAGDQSQYSMNPYMAGANGVYNQYQQQPQYAMNRYGYGSMQPDMGYNIYTAGYGFGKTQLCAGAGGKWTTAPPMPSYPPPCSKEEKKEKIAKWLRKRENRNWSNKPSYPVRHSIAKNRKRGEDGRFITKARLAEMAAEEAAVAATRGNGNEPQKTSPLSSTSEEAPISIVSQTTMPQATPVP